jgi:uncharacterized protein (DUF433 family)
MAILGNGVYSLPEAARLTSLRTQRVREWFLGRPNEERRKAVFRSDYQSIRGDQAVSFHDLIELFVAGQMRNHGVSLQSLRKVHAQLKHDLKTRHPFCRREIMSDGRRVFTLGLDKQGKREMIDVLNRQRVFAEILLPFLRRIAYDEATQIARKWMIADLVVIDPTICFGKPIVEPIGIATAVLAAAYQANDQNTEIVANWYKVHPSHVLAAVNFEKSLEKSLVA